jgi:DnaK suppressor protein
MSPIQHDTAVIRARLAADRVTALAQLAAVSADIASLIAAADGSNSDDEHDPEGATIAFERAQLQALERAARAQVEQLDAALARLAQGAYGECVTCGREIGAERLAVRPSANRCVECAAAGPDPRGPRG